MFVYRPPKDSCWGHSIGNDWTSAQPKLEAFLDTYFDRVESQGPTSWVLAWKDSVLPKIDWPEAFQGTENEMVRRFLFSAVGNRVMFPIGIVFPLSSTDPASFEFLRRFSADTPFKMSAKHFMVGVISAKGRFAWRKPDADIAAQLEDMIG
jgi:hypothetical protein